MDRFVGLAILFLGVLWLGLSVGVKPVQSVAPKSEATVGATPDATRTALALPMHEATTIALRVQATVQAIQMDHDQKMATQNRFLGYAFCLPTGIALIVVLAFAWFTR